MENQSPIVIGIDVGTSSVKVCAIDAFTEEVIDQKCSVYEFEGKQRPSNRLYSQQNVKIIIDCVQNTINCLHCNKSNIQAISICGQMHGVVLWQPNAWKYIDGWYSINESKVSDLYTWQDMRCDEDFLKSLPESSVRVASGYGCATIFWLKSFENEYLHRFEYCGTIMDLLVSMICGLQRPMISLQNAVSFGFCDPKTKTWNVNSLNGANFPVHILPEIIEVESKEQFLFNQWLNIEPKTKVFIAFGDTQCAIYAAIRNQTDCAVLNAGTSMQMCLLATDSDGNEIYSKNQSLEYFPYFDNKYLTVAASLNGGNVLQNFVEKLTEFIHLVTDVNIDTGVVWNRLISAAINNDALHIDNQLEINPRIFGERIDPRQRGQINGISNSTTIPEMFSSICRSLIKNIFNLITIDFLRTSEIKSLVVIGNAFSANSILRSALIEFLEELRNKHNICIEVTFNFNIDANIGVAIFGAYLLKQK